MPSAIARGDIFALTITLIAFFFAVVVINRLTGLLIVFLKKAILFIIVTLAFWQFFALFTSRWSAEGLTLDLFISGAAGILAGLLAIGISLFMALRSFNLARQEPLRRALDTGGPVPSSTGAGLSAGEASKGMPQQVLAGAPAMDAPRNDAAGGAAAISGALSVSSLKTDRSLGAVLAYLVIAQFGVFSSKTIPAPTFQVGLAFFALFIIAGLFFIHITYNNYVRGLRHLAMAIIAGGAIAVVLGHFWVGIPLDQLLSPAFFQSEALVALVTGLALSLFMGGKG